MIESNCEVVELQAFGGSYDGMRVLAINVELYANVPQWVVLSGNWKGRVITHTMAVNQWANLSICNVPDIISWCLDGCNIKLNNCYLKF